MYKRQKFSTALVISILLHMLMLLLSFIGLPSYIEPLKEEKDAMTFDVVSLAEFSNIKNQSPKATKEISLEKSREVKKSTEKKPVEKKPDIVEKKPEIIEKKQEQPEPIVKENSSKLDQDPATLPAPKEKQVTKPQEQKEKSVTKKENIEKPQEKKLEKKPQKPTEKKIDKPVEKKIEKPAERNAPAPKKAPNNLEQDSIDSILKNIEEASDGDDKNAPANNLNNKQKGEFFSQGADYDEESPLSITEKMLVKNHIQKHWTPPVAADKISDVRVLIKITLAKDRKVESADILKIQCPDGAERTCQLVSESALRAVWNSSPILNLSPNRYDTWKEFDLFFDPSNIGQ